MKKTPLYISAAVLAAGAVLVAVPVFAAGRFKSTSGVPRPALIGIVTAISGTTLTVAAMVPKMYGMRGGATSTLATATAYTVDASSATVTSGFGTTTTAVALSSVAVGSRVAVSGTVSGTSVAATKIALIPAMPEVGARKPGNSMPGWQGNQGGAGHVAMGAVTAINGSQFTIASKMFKQATTTETVVTTSATTFKENGQPATLGSLAVGNMVMATVTTTAPNVFTANTVRIMTSRGLKVVR